MARTRRRRRLKLRGQTWPARFFPPFSSMNTRSEPIPQVRKMEEEQEEMGNSLMALTSHYAKVQLRLQQVVSAPVDSREELLKDLHSFASMGIPDLRGRGGGLGNASRDSEETQEAAVAEQGRKQAAAIAQLRAQLEELENYAYQVDKSRIRFGPTFSSTTILVGRLSTSVSSTT